MENTKRNKNKETNLKTYRQSVLSDTASLRRAKASQNSTENNNAIRPSLNSQGRSFQPVNEPLRTAENSSIPEIHEWNIPESLGPVHPVNDDYSGTHSFAYDNGDAGHLENPGNTPQITPEANSTADYRQELPRISDMLTPNRGSEAYSRHKEAVPQYSVNEPVVSYTASSDMSVSDYHADAVPDINVPEQRTHVEVPKRYSQDSSAGPKTLNNYDDVSAVRRANVAGENNPYHGYNPGRNPGDSYHVPSQTLSDANAWNNRSDNSAVIPEIRKPAEVPTRTYQSDDVASIRRNNLANGDDSNSYSSDKHGTPAETYRKPTQRMASDRNSGYSLVNQDLGLARKQPVDEPETVYVQRKSVAVPVRSSQNSSENTAMDTASIRRANVTGKSTHNNSYPRRQTVSKPEENTRNDPQEEVRADIVPDNRISWEEPSVTLPKSTSNIERDVSEIRRENIRNVSGEDRFSRIEPEPADNREYHSDSSYEISSQIIADATHETNDTVRDISLTKKRSDDVSEPVQEGRKPVEVPKRPSQRSSEELNGDVASIRRKKLKEAESKKENIKDDEVTVKTVNDMKRNSVSRIPETVAVVVPETQERKNTSLDVREEINREIRSHKKESDSSEEKSEIPVSNTTLDNSKILALRAEKDSNGKQRQYKVGKNPDNNQDVILDLLSKQNPNFGTVNGLVHSNPNKPASANDKMNAIVDILYDDSYVNALRTNAKTTASQIEKLERKRKQLNQQTEYANLTEKQISEYSFQSDNIDREINRLKTRFNNLEKRYMRQTGRDFEGNPSHNIMDVAMHQVKLDKDRCEVLKRQIKDLEEKAVTSKEAELTKEIIIQKKKNELKRQEQKLKESETEALEIQTWQDSAEGQRKIKKWEKREERLKKRDAKRKSGVRGAINKGIDTVEEVTLRPVRTVQHGINNVIDKGIYVAKTPLRMMRNALNSASSRMYMSLMKAKSFRAVNNAFSTVGNAVRGAKNNAKHAIGKALSKASGAVKKILLSILKFLFLDPIGLTITGAVAVFFLLAYTYDPTGNDLPDIDREGDILDIANYDVDTAYSKYVFEVREDTIEFRQKYRVYVSPADVAALLTSSMDQEIFSEFMNKENYVQVIDALLAGDKAVTAANAFLKQVDYKYYYLVRDWEDWNYHSDQWVTQEDYDSSADSEDWVGVSTRTLDEIIAEDAFDEIGKEVKEITIQKKIADPSACDFKFPVPDNPPDRDDYTPLVYPADGGSPYYDYSLTDYDSYNEAINEYNDAVDASNNCHADPIKYDCYNVEPRSENHEVFKTRNFRSQKWVRINPESLDEGMIGENAELTKDSTLRESVLTVGLEEQGHNGVGAAITEEDNQDRPAEGKEYKDIWLWFNDIDHDQCRTWRGESEGSTQYYLKKEKFWDTWTFQELSTLLAINYNIKMFDKAPVAAKNFKNFHVKADNPRIIEIWDTEGVYQDVDVDLDKFYKDTSFNQFSIYEYNPASSSAPMIVAKLGALKKAMEYYLGDYCIDDIPPEDELTDEELVKMRNIEHLSREEQNELVPELALIDDEGIRKMLTYAVSLMGTPYIHSHDLNASGGLDCSGFAYWIVNNCGNGWHMPFATTYGYVGNCNSGYVKEVSRDDLQPGDFIVIDWNNCGDYSHMGVYMGDGRIIHTGGNPDGVSFQYLNNPAYTHWYNSPKKYYRLTEKVRGG